MALILLLAGVTSAFITVLGMSLAAAGHPSATVRPQAVGLAVALPLLILLLPSAGGLGASAICVLTGVISATLMLVAGLRILGGGPRDYLRPTADDLGVVRALLVTRVRSRRGLGQPDGEGRSL